jgi:Protein of unknown function (DUF2934)
MAKTNGKKRDTAAPTSKRRKKSLPRVQPQRLTISDEELYDQVARKAYELYEQRGEEHGHDLDDWLTAERLVQEELLHGPLPEEPVMEEG